MGIDDTICEYRLTKDEATTQLLRLMLRPPLVAQMVLMLLAGVMSLALVPGRQWWAYALVIFPLFWLYFCRRLVHNAVAQHPELLETQALRFDASGFRVSNSVTSLELPWGRVRGVLDRPGFIVLRMDTVGSGAVIPKRAFTSEQLQAFLGHAQSAARG